MCICEFVYLHICVLSIDVYLYICVFVYLCICVLTIDVYLVEHVGRF